MLMMTPTYAMLLSWTRAEWWILIAAVLVIEFLLIILLLGIFAGPRDSDDEEDSDS